MNVMLELFIDTSTKYLNLILLKNSIVIDSLNTLGDRKHTEQTIPAINNLLAKNNHQLSDIQKFYITMGPGSYTGVKVAMVIVKVIKTINEKVEIYTINSLIYQSGLDDCVSMIDARGGKWYFAVISKGKEVIPTQLLIDENANEIASGFAGFIVRKDLDEIDYVDNFLKLKNNFIKIENLDDLEPMYIKSVI